MKDFAYCFEDLAKSFQWFDENRQYTRQEHKRSNTENYNSETKSNKTKPINPLDKLSTSAVSANNTVDHEISSTKQNSVWTSSASGKFP